MSNEIASNSMLFGLNVELSANDLGDATYVQFRESPFTKKLIDLVHPTRMIREESLPGWHRIVFHFEVSDDQRRLVAEELHDVLLRIGQLVRYAPQVDSLLEPIAIAINDEFLPDDVIKIPINLNSYIIQGQQNSRFRVELNWLPQFLVNSCFSVELVRHISIEEMANRIKLQVLPREVTRSAIEAYLGAYPLNSQHALNYQCINLRLTCPLSMQRMQLPCRAANCIHLECFDLIVFLERVSNHYNWLCPVCALPFFWEDLCIDQYVFDLLMSFNLSTVLLETPVAGILTPVSDQSDPEDEAFGNTRGSDNEAEVMYDNELVDVNAASRVPNYSNEQPFADITDESCANNIAIEFDEIGLSAQSAENTYEKVEGNAEITLVDEHDHVELSEADVWYNIEFDEIDKFELEKVDVVEKEKKDIRIEIIKFNYDVEHATDDGGEVV